MSATLTPEEIAAFCDAVEDFFSVAQMHDLAGGHERRTFRESRQKINTMLPKLRAMAEPAAVPVSELRAFIEDEIYRGIAMDYKRAWERVSQTLSQWIDCKPSDKWEDGVLCGYKSVKVIMDAEEKIGKKKAAPAAVPED